MSAQPELARVDLARAAMRYAEKGWHVFPVHSVRAGAVCSCGAAHCQRIGKHPRTKHGLKDATTDVKQIAAWWIDWPDANIGIAPWPSGMIVLDIDPRNDGTNQLAQLEKEYGQLPDTMRAFTGGGGQHIYFRIPDGTDRVPSRVLRQGVELKAQGTYILAAPSSHVSAYLRGGQGYIWDQSQPELPSDAPFWLVESPPPGKVYEKTTRPPIEGVLGAAFTHAGMTGRVLGADKVTVQCPWEDEHTQGERFDSSTVVFGPSGGSNLGFFHCSHSHCHGRTIRDVLARLPKESVEHAKAVVPKAIKTLSTIAAEEWEKVLARKSSGEVSGDPGNLMLLLENLPEWRGVLGLDESRGKIMWRREIPEWGLKSPARAGKELQDGDYIDIAHWFRIVRGISFKKEAVGDVINHVASRQRFNSLHEHLLALEPGPPVLDTWLSKYLGAEDTEYTRAVGRWWLVSAMARAFDPGCQADHCLILEGAQGIGKTTVFRLLGGAWYDGSTPRLESTDALISFQGVWIREFGELAAFGRSDFATIKAILTEKVDRFRPPYGRNFIEAPRRCVFCASANPGEDYIRDPTGARRFWPVVCSRIDLAGFSKIRDALLAEALQAYRDGEPWHPQNNSPELTSQIQEVQGARQATDPWTERVLSRLVEPVSTNQLFDALGIPLEKRDQASSRRIAKIARAHGYENKSQRNALDGDVVRVWKK